MNYINKVSMVNTEKYAGQFYQAILEKIGYAILVIDISAFIVYANSEAQKLFKADSNYLTGKNFLKLMIQPENQYEFTQKLEASEETHCYEGYLNFLNNESIAENVHFKITPIFETDNHLTGFIIAYSPATAIFESARNFEELIKNESQYKQFVETANEGFWVIDNNFKTTFVNARISEILGYQQHELIGKTPFEFMDEGNANICMVHIKNIDNLSVTAIKFNLNFKHKEGRPIYTYISIAGFRNEKGKLTGTFMLVNDITETELLKKQIEQTEKELVEKYSFNDIKGKSKAMLEIFELLPITAESDCNVLIEGASGTGKSLIAKTIHSLSNRAKGPFIVVNCGAIPETLLESELFGYVKGAFTDAKKDKPGRFSIAAGGTIFLDEISEMPIHLQVKLLRVIEEKLYEPLGDVKSQKADVRIIAASNKNFEEIIRAGKFREDLYYRLKVINIKIPPLRERRDDIELLTKSFIKKLNERHSKAIADVAPDVKKFFAVYSFPGNVRELQNMIEHAFIFCKNDIISFENFSSEYKQRFEEILNVVIKQPAILIKPEPANIANENINGNFKEITKKSDLWKRDKILQVLEECGYNKTIAAEKLKISRMALWRRMKKYDLL